MQYPEKPSQQQPQQPQQAYPAYQQGGYQQGYYQQQPPMAPQPYQEAQPGYPAAQGQPAQPYYYSPGPTAAQGGYNTYGQSPVVGVVAYPQQIQQQQPQQPVYMTTPLQPRPYDDSSATVSLFVFIAGFLCFPIWCAGFAYVRSLNPKARQFGRLSVGMLICSTVLLSVYLVVFYAFVANVTDGITCVEQDTGSACFAASSSCRMCVQNRDSGICISKSNSYCSGSLYSDMGGYCSGFDTDSCPSDCIITPFGCSSS